MPIFEFEGNDAEGKTVRGTVFGANPQAVEHELRRRGLSHTQVRSGYAASDPLGAHSAISSSPSAVSAAAPHASSTMAPPLNSPSGPTQSAPDPGVGAVFTQAATAKDALFGVPRSEDQFFFFRQLAALTDAGISVYEAMESMARQSRNMALRAFAQQATVHISGGGHLSDLMRNHPALFTPLQLALVVAGERGGYLPRAFAQIAEQLESDIRLQNLVRRVTFYPKLVLVFSVLVVLFANGIIGAFGAPGSIKLWNPLLEVQTWLFLGPLLLLLFWFFRYGVRKPQVREFYDSVVCYLPYVGHTMRQFAMARFGRAFGAMYRAAVPMGEALSIAAASTGNSLVRRGLEPAAIQVQQGRGIAEALIETRMLDQTVVDMIATGERTGNLDHMLLKMAEYYEGEAKLRSYKSAQVLGVIVFLMVAVFVFYIVINFYSQYFGRLGSFAAE